VTQANVATFRRHHELLNETGEAPLELLDPSRKRTTTASGKFAAAAGIAA
jgi:hypothetical protein